MDVKKITALYKTEIKKYLKGNDEDSHLLTELQKEEIYTDHSIDIDYLAEQYALELTDCIDVLKSKGLL